MTPIDSQVDAISHRRYRFVKTQIVTLLDALIVIGCNNQVLSACLRMSFEVR